jgi:hypothetical protein
MGVVTRAGYGPTQEAKPSARGHRRTVDAAFDSKIGGRGMGAQVGDENQNGERLQGEAWNYPTRFPDGMDLSTEEYLWQRPKAHGSLGHTSLNGG